jgi:hypothetical protein
VFSTGRPFTTLPRYASRAALLGAALALARPRGDQPMNDTFSNARQFILTHARLLERMLFQVHFAHASPASVAQAVRAYRNPDGGLGHALEPDLRCPESQPLFVEVGLAALQEAGCRDQELALSVCSFLKSVSNESGLVSPFLETARRSPHAAHMIHSAVAPDLNPTIGLCGLLHYQGVQHPWLSRATETCCDMLIRDPPLEAHTLLGATRLADHLPDRTLARCLVDTIASVLPQARFYIAEAPVQGYGLTPLHFAPDPTSNWRALFLDDQIAGHLQDLKDRQQPDGGWPIDWDAPGPAAVLEWRGRGTLDAIRRLVAYGFI